MTESPNKKKFNIICILFIISFLICLTIAITTKSTEKTGLTILDAIILGLVEGITEYLPVSSTGHLIFIQELIGLAQTDADKKAADSYAIIIQLGAILAVAGLYRQKVWQIILGLFGKNKDGLHLFIIITIAFLPSAIIGLIFLKQIKNYLFGHWPITIAWIIGGILLIVWRGHRKKEATSFRLSDISYKQALLIGFFQCLALIPGMSRSLSTILGGIVVGVPLIIAVEFSFLLGCLTLSAASCYEIYKNGSSVLKMYDPSIALLGLVVSLLSAAVAVKWLVNYLKEKDMAIFGYYRITIGILAIVYLTLLNK